MTTDNDTLLDYYQRELFYLRQAGADFADLYPKVASRLQLGPDGTSDPHVERLIESFAYLTARVQRSIDGEFPRLTEGLLGILHPQLAAQIPAMGIARFTTEAPSAAGIVLPRGLGVSAITADYLRCRFRTCFSTTIWPITVAVPDHVSTDQWSFLDREDAASAIRLTLQAPPETWAALAGQRLRLYLGGAATNALRLTDALLGSCHRVAFVAGDGGHHVASAEHVLQQAGFADDEAVLPDFANGHPAYRLLQEYFAFPEKFRFFDLTIPDIAALPGLAEAGVLDVLFVLPEANRGAFALSAESFQLGCTPVINLFNHLADPVRLDWRRGEYRIVPDARLERVMEVHSITRVQSNAVVGERRVEYAPYFSVDHGIDRDVPTRFWMQRRLPNDRSDTPGSDTWLSFVDLSLTPASPAETTVLVHTMCTNRILPEQIPAGATLEPEQPASGARGVLIGRPTPPRAAPIGGDTAWRVVSQLSLNYLSLTDGPTALAALQEILRLHAPSGDAASEQQIIGLKGLVCRQIVRRIGLGVRMAPVQGLAIELSVDERNFAGGSALLFASVLEQFFRLYVSMNTFTELSVRSVQRREVWRRWPAHPGMAPRT
jgi:type VI secretion system protein ImpG